MRDGTSGETLELFSTEWLAPLLLLGLRGRDSYADELARKIADFGLETERSEVQQTLWALEEEGLVVFGSDGLDGRLDGGRCSITRLGEAYLESWASSLTLYQEEVEMFFQVYGDGGGRRAQRLQTR